MKFSHIAWDFDGTLYHSYPQMVSCLKRSLEAFGYTDTEENIARKVHVTLGVAFEHYAPLCGVTEAQLGFEYRKRASVLSDLIQPYPGIPELLRDIVLAGGRNHLCTNRRVASCRAYFDRDGLTPYFDVCAGPDLFPQVKLKPDPALIQAILDARNLEPTELLMVGDRNLDIESAHNAGALGCFIDLDGYSTPTSSPEFLAENVDQLREILLG